MFYYTRLQSSEFKSSVVFILELQIQCRPKHSLRATMSKWPVVQWQFWIPDSQTPTVLTWRLQAANVTPVSLWLFPRVGESSLVYQNEDKDGLCPFFFLPIFTMLSSFLLPSFTHSRQSDGKGLSRGVCCYCWWKAFVALLEWHFNSFLSFVVRTKGAIGQKSLLPSPFLFFLFICTHSYFSQTRRKEQHAVCLSGWTLPFLASRYCHEGLTVAC